MAAAPRRRQGGGSRTLARVSQYPDQTRKELGRKLAFELVHFIRTSTPDREAAGQVMLGAYEVLERNTRMVRGVSPFPPEAGDDWPDYDDPR